MEGRSWLIKLKYSNFSQKLFGWVYGTNLAILNILVGYPHESHDFSQILTNLCVYTDRNQIVHTKTPLSSLFTQNYHF